MSDFVLPDRESYTAWGDFLLRCITVRALGFFEIYARVGRLPIDKMIFSSSNGMGHAEGL